MICIKTRCAIRQDSQLSEEYYMIYTALKALTHDMRLIFVENETRW
jgi:hypothetical protein